MAYTCDPNADIGSRISEMTLLSTGKAIDPSRNYTVAGWGSVNENVEGPAIFDLMQDYLLDRDTVSIASNQAIKVI